uniref:Serpentine receptor class gamma n=1 Tax=Strongyloides venezuelensis TaxID=75913 RepID=A0A0K0F805_STRVS
MCYVLQNSSDINIGFRAKWMSNNAAWYNSFLVTSILSFIFLAISFIVNVSTLLILIKMSKETNKTTTQGNVKSKFNFARERNFFLTALTSFIGQLILGIDNYASGYFNQTKQYNNFYIMVMMFPIVNDLTIFPSVWLLLYVSTPMRKIILSVFKRKKSIEITIQNKRTTILTGERLNLLFSTDSSAELYGHHSSQRLQEPSKPDALVCNLCYNLLSRETTA